MKYLPLDVRKIIHLINQSSSMKQIQLVNLYEGYNSDLLEV